MRRVVALIGRILALAAAGAALAVTSCGGGDGGSEAGKPAELTVGTLPILETAPLQIANERGYFKQERLKVRTQSFAGGAAVVSGSVQIGWGNTTSTLIAASRGLPIKVIAPGSQSGSGGRDISSLVVPKRSPVRRASQLAGKTIAVPTLSSIAGLAVQRTLEKAGVDVHDVKLTEIEFPDMPAAIASGRVGAAMIVEPFRTVVLGQGAREVAKPFTATMQGDRLQTTEWLTSASYLGSHRDVVDRFVKAIERANAYAAGHPAAVRKALLAYTKIPPPLAKKTRLPIWTRTLDEPSVRLQLDLLDRYGQLEKRPSLEDLGVESG
jgi:NitT/TauT family transport system substrate-binding protein